MQANIVLLLPQEHRDEPAEKIIGDSLTDFFTSQFRFSPGKVLEETKHGYPLFIAGVIRRIDQYQDFC